MLGGMRSLVLALVLVLGCRRGADDDSATADPAPKKKKPTSESSDDKPAPSASLPDEAELIALAKVASTAVDASGHRRSNACRSEGQRSRG